MQSSVATAATTARSPADTTARATPDLRGRGTNLTILSWHNIAATPFFNGGADAFARQVRAIRRLGNPVPLAPALDALRNGRPLPPRAVALTFDDGYRDNLEVALPILRRLGVPATFFLVPGYLSRTTRCWWETVAWAVGRSRRPHIEWNGRELPAAGAPGWRTTAETICGDLKELPHAGRDAAVSELIDRLAPAGSEREVADLFMDWDDARRLAAQADVGSHSGEHAILARETADYQRADLAGSRRTLASELGAPVDLLAYPNGTAADFDATTIAAATDAGYLGAVTTIEGVNGRGAPPYELRRFVLSPRWDPGMVRFLGRIFLAAARGRTA